MSDNLTEELFDLYELSLKKDDKEYENSFPYINSIYNSMTCLNEQSSHRTNNSYNGTNEDNDDSENNEFYIFDNKPIILVEENEEAYFDLYTALLNNNYVNIFIYLI